MIKDLSRFKNPFVLSAIILVVIIVGLVVRFLTLPAGEHGTEEVVRPQMPAASDDETADIQDDAGAEDIALLYVQDGDLWQSDSSGENQIKLIDRDRIHSVQISPDKQSIAYTLEVTEKKTVTTYEGVREDREFTRTNLLLADNKGANSYMVKEGVVRWGWIPSTNILWYESDVLTQLFDWDYFGNQDIWTFDPSSKESKLLVKDEQILNPMWSPDGSKLSYVGYRLDENNRYKSLLIRMVNRNDSAKRDLFDVPYVGGDRGGPPPVPSVYWSRESDALYTAFTPMLWSEDSSMDNRFTSGYLSVWKIPVNGSEAVKLAPEVPSTVLNDETRPRIVFNEDFSKVAYARLDEKDVAGKNPSEWYYSDDQIESLAVYDLTSKTEKILIENFKSEGAVTFFGEDSLYLLNNVKNTENGKNETVIKKIDLSSGVVQEFKTAEYADRYGVEVMTQLKGSGLIYLIIDSIERGQDSLVVFDENSGTFKTVIDKISGMDFYRK